MAQLLSSLPLGAKVKFGKYQVGSETPTEIKWVIVAKNHTGYPANSITLRTEYVIDQRAMDAREDAGDGSGGKHAVEHGSNYYKYSNMDQWLNSDANAGEWYSPTHSGDAAPSTATVYIEGLGNQPRLLNKGSYSEKAGFLNLFSAAEKSVILTTPIVCAKPAQVSSYYEITYETIDRKVFLPSVTETMGFSDAYGKEGSEWEGADYGSDKVTPELIANTNSSMKPSTNTLMNVWSRTPCRVSSVVSNQNAYFAYANVYGTTNDSYSPCISSVGIRPALNISANTGVSDTTDSDGYYIMFLNTVPSTPAHITVPATVYGGKSVPISWDESIDDDGNFGNYILERQADGGSWVEIYRGTTPSYTDSFPLTPPVDKVAYRVRAYDVISNTPYSYSEYVTSPVRTVINNYPPVITVESSNLGVMTDQFTTRYKVSDANGTKPTVTIHLDDAVVYTGNPSTSDYNDINISGETWLRLNNGSHKITINATDGVDSDSETILFTKSVSHILISNHVPLYSETAPGRIRLSVTRKIPEGAIFKVYVCNNGHDVNPTWEDMTYEVENNDVYVFTNATKTEASWGIGIKVEVDRNGATGECYISQIGGNFE
jgi:hypothetical protein